MSAPTLPKLQLIQEQSTTGGRKTPLILIHDGGGTIFQYFMLGQLDRDVYGIPNPRFSDGGLWKGGVPEVAKAYLEAIRETISGASLLLGGWSFGGMVSVEIAKIIQDDTQLHVRGLLLIDSVCPWSRTYQDRGPVVPQFRETTPEHMREKTRRCFASTGTMLSTWDKPLCFRSPPAVLLRADEGTRWPGQRSGSETYDQDGRLGWSEYEALTIRKIIGLPGDHFSIWHGNRLSYITEVIKDNCNILERSEF